MLDNWKIPGEALDKAAASILEHAGKEIVGGVSSFSSNLFGAVIGDRVKEWRTRNLMEMAAKTAKKMEELGVSLDKTRGLPMLEYYSIFEEASKQDDPSVQDLWAGLLASRMSPEHAGNFDRQTAQILSAMNGVEARVLHFVHESSEIEKAMDMKMPTYDQKRAEQDPKAYGEEMNAIRLALLDELWSRVRTVYKDYFSDVAPERVSEATGSLHLKELLYSREAVISNHELNKTDHINIDHHSHPVKSIDSGKLLKVIRNLQTGEHRKGRASKLLSESRYQFGMLVAFTALGEAVMKSCMQR